MSGSGPPWGINDGGHVPEPIVPKTLDTYLLPCCRESGLSLPDSFRELGWTRNVFVRRTLDRPDLSNEVVVVGSINADYVISLHHRPAPGETVGDATLELHPGGKGANQAVAAARSGASVCMVARVGAVLDRPYQDRGTRGRGHQHGPHSRECGRGHRHGLRHAYPRW